MGKLKQLNAMRKLAKDPEAAQALLGGGMPGMGGGMPGMPGGMPGMGGGMPGGIPGPDQLGALSAPKSAKAKTAAKSKRRKAKDARKKNRRK